MAKIVADTSSPVINNIRTFFDKALKIFPFEVIRNFFPPVTANPSASNRPILVFVSCPQVSGNWQKPKRNYMAADGYTEKIRV